MTYKKQLIYFAFVVLLILLYLVSSTDFIYKEQENEIYNVSVILNQTTDSGFANTKLGMKMVERHYTIDLNIITLYEANDVLQQMEFILREIENGAQAILVMPVDTEALARLLNEQAPVNVPIISLGTTLSASPVRLSVEGDEKTQMLALAEQIAKDGIETVYVFASAIERNNKTRRIEYLEGYFAEVGIGMETLNYIRTEGLENMLREISRRGDKDGVIALDQETLERLAGLNETLEVTRVPLYGVGYTDKILNYLERDVIQAVTIHNDYDLGYLGLSLAIELIEGKSVKVPTTVMGTLVTKENLYEKFNEKILFPLS